ncbi:MAG: ATP-binding protein [Vicinamibacterales bacterium]
MKPSDVRAVLTKTIPAGIPVLLVGAPGVGKSDVVGQATKSVGAQLIVSHPAVSDPTDAKGLPWVSADHESARFLPFGDLAQAVKATTPTVWFLDDLGQAPASVQASFMQLLLARRVNEHQLPACVTFVAATNRRTDRANVSGVLEPVKSRFGAIVELEPDLDDWCAWALTHGVAPEIIAFLRFRPELLSKFTPTADLTNSPMPRTWANASKVMGLTLAPETRRQMLCGAVGEGATVELLAYLQVYDELPDLDDLIANPTAFRNVPKKPATLYAVVTGLASKATTDTLSSILTYAERMLDKGHGEFAALLLRDIVRRDAALMSQPAFMAVMRGPLGRLIDS